MDHWKGIIGASFTPAGFDQYCHSLTWPQWRPSFVALHNTEIPTLAALTTLHAVLGLDPATIRLHKEDTCSTHKHCPGKNVSKAAVIEKVRDLLQARHPGDHLPPPPVA